MNVLIMSCGTGGGHNSAAMAVKAEMERGGHTVTLLNPYDLRSGKLAHVVDEAYIRVATYTPIFFGILYTLGNLYRRLPWHSPVYLLNRRMAGKMDAYFKDHPTDAVVMTHFFPGQILTGMKDKGMDVPPSVLVATDYTCLPFAEECRCEAYVIPTEDLTKSFTRRGVPEEKIYPLGIPVNSAFHHGTPREEAKRALGMQMDKHYILISGGSIGAGKLPRTIRILDELTRESNAVRIVVICGSNTALYKKLKKRFGDRVDVIGSTTKMPLYMRACELYVTKAGGLSTTEAAVNGTLLALLPSIPGCESYNIHYFEKRGMGRRIHANKPSLSRMLTVLGRDAVRENMIASQHAHIHADAAERIAALTCELAENAARQNEESA